MQVSLLTVITSALLVACSSTIEVAPRATIELYGPVSYSGTSGILYDTVWFTGKIPDYSFQVRFVGNGGLLTINPTIAFDGTGSATHSPISDGQLVKVSYQPNTAGRRCIMFYWYHNDCVYLPEEKVMLFVDFLQENTK